MPHEYLYSVYSATNEVIGTLQSIIMVSSQEDCSAVKPLHGMTINTHGISNTAFSSKTEVAQMINCIMSCDHAIPIHYQSTVHFSNTTESRISVSIPNDILMVQM